MKSLMKMNLLLLFKVCIRPVIGSNSIAHMQCIPQKQQQEGLKVVWAFLSPMNRALQVSFQKQKLTHKSLTNVDLTYWSQKPA